MTHQTFTTFKHSFVASSFKLPGNCLQVLIRLVQETAKFVNIVENGTVDKLNLEMVELIYL